MADIYAYTLQSWGRAQADAYLDKIEKAFHQLLEHPKIGKVRPDIKQSYRCLYIEKHVLFYKIVKTDIHILGIVRSRMDVMNQLL